jgi:hypothetical protein
VCDTAVVCIDMRKKYRCVETKTWDAIPLCFVLILPEGSDPCLKLKSNRRLTPHGS